MEKKLMLGNEAVARGLYENGVLVSTAYPGTPSTEISEYAAKYDEIYAEWSPNEKVALEVAIGASVGGARAFCAMKHVGLNVAADPLFTVAYTGVNGGLVIGVADDPSMHSSQNQLVIRAHLRKLKNNALNLRREQIYAFYFEHIISSALNRSKSVRRSATSAWFRYYIRNISGSIPQNRHSLFC